MPRQCLLPARHGLKAKRYGALCGLFDVIMADELAGSAFESGAPTASFKAVATAIITVLVNPRPTCLRS